MLKRFSCFLAQAGVAAIVLLPKASAEPAPGQRAPDLTAALGRALAAAEGGLRHNEHQIAESRYRSALLEGWLLKGSLAAAEGDLPAARAAFERALTAAVETRRARTSLALVHLRLGEHSEAVHLLRSVVTRHPDEARARRLLAQALIAAGRPEEAVQELEEAVAASPADAESAFNLATGHLRLSDVEKAERLFEDVFRARPIPQTRVLIGRTYRDYKDYDRARRALHEALEMDPKVRRAHYYLGTVELLGRGYDGLEVALGWFEKELELAPQDPMTNLYFGMALAESRRFEDAIPALEAAAAWEPTRLDALRFLGRCLLGEDRVAEALGWLREALELAGSAGARDRQLSMIHYQLGLALRRSGRESEAAVHFEAAEGLSSQLVEEERDRFSSFLAETAGLEANPEAFRPPIETALLESFSAEERRGLAAEVDTALAQAYLNLGVLQLRQSRGARAVELFAGAVEADAGLPRAQYSLGVALFNAERFAEAVEPLARAFEQDAANAELRRMLALALLNAEAYGQAADLLEDDGQRGANPSLQYAYGLALTRSGRAAEAEAVFDRLIAENATWPELHVVLGQAHAEQGDYEAAVAALEHALALAPDVADAHATLGDLYLRQGKLEEAEAELRAELSSHPGDLRARYHLATVLDLNRKSRPAREELEKVLGAQPEFANARYLLGKILLAEGAAEEATAHLEVAARLSPEDPNIFYQLGQAYQRLGRVELATRQFEIYRGLKRDQRSDGS